MTRAPTYLSLSLSLSLSLMMLIWPFGLWPVQWPFSYRGIGCEPVTTSGKRETCVLQPRSTHCLLLSPASSIEQGLGACFSLAPPSPFHPLRDHLRPARAFASAASDGLSPVLLGMGRENDRSV